MRLLSCKSSRFFLHEGEAETGHAYEEMQPEAVVFLHSSSSSSSVVRQAVFLASAHTNTWYLPGYIRNRRWLLALRFYSYST